MKELRPCPFCGGEVNITYHSASNCFNVWHNGDRVCKLVEPMQINGAYASCLKEAKDIWNKRTIPWWDKEALS